MYTIWKDTGYVQYGDMSIAAMNILSVYFVYICVLSHQVHNE